MTTYTLEALKVMTPERRSQLYRNAAARRDNGGQAIIDLIDESGLPLRSGGMRMSDPVYLRMEEIVWSSAGRAAAIAATEQGLPAMAGIDPLLQADLGKQYHQHDQGTMNAGFIVAELMRHLGYVDAGQGKLPGSCVAKTAMRWKPRRR